eukprot:TRINITY_DN3391_c0_g1_i3.p1 TRINITY_DN3391_c0_g1~~TRINITY_DN3391_c0_g1_i3.p1  ORF type:complete len:453 (-),score=64.69 TRINITY_DN3391_c0_g1_i3:1113-2471(-)
MKLLPCKRLWASAILVAWLVCAGLAYVFMPHLSPAVACQYTTECGSGTENGAGGPLGVVPQAEAVREPLEYKRYATEHEVCELTMEQVQAMSDQEVMQVSLDRGFGIVLAAFGNIHNSARFFAEAMVVMRRVWREYPAIPIELWVGGDELEQQRRAIDALRPLMHVAACSNGSASVQWAGPYCSVILRSLDEVLARELAYEGLFGLQLKPVVVTESSFDVPLFLDTDVMQCPGRLPELLRAHLSACFDVMAHPSYPNPTRGFWDSQSVFFDVPPELHEDFAKQFRETNLGVILFNKRSPMGVALLFEWIYQCERWRNKWAIEYTREKVPSLDEDLRVDADQGPLRLAMWAMHARGAELRWGQALGSSELQRHVWEGVNGDHCEKNWRGTSLIFVHGTLRKVFSSRMAPVGLPADELEYVVNICRILSSLPQPTVPACDSYVEQNASSPVIAR